MRYCCSVCGLENEVDGYDLAASFEADLFVFFGDFFFDEEGVVAAGYCVDVRHGE